MLAEKQRQAIGFFRRRFTYLFMQVTPSHWLSLAMQCGGMRVREFTFGTGGWGMNVRILGLGLLVLLILPTMGRAQSTGQVECPRAGGYVYLYSSMTTLEVRTTLQCKELVQVTGRFDGYFGVRTATGDVGYVPQDSLLLLKDAPGVKRSSLGAPRVNREPVAYDDPALRAKPPVEVKNGPEFTLKNNTQVRVVVVNPVSSATAKVGEAVELQVSEDVLVDGMVVIAKGAPAVGTVTEVEAKKRLGHSGKVGMKITEVTLENGQKVVLRAYHDTSGGMSASGDALPTVVGKDAGFPKGDELPAWTDGDVKLLREDFQKP